MATFNLDTNDLDNPKLLGAAIMFFHALGAKLPEVSEGVYPSGEVCMRFDAERLASAVEKYAAELKAGDSQRPVSEFEAATCFKDTSFMGDVGNAQAAAYAALSNLPVVAQVHDETQYPLDAMNRVMGQMATDLAALPPKELKIEALLNEPDAATVGFGAPQLQAEPNPAQVFGAARSSAAVVPSRIAQGTSMIPSPDASTLVLSIGGAADASQASAASTSPANGVTLDRDGLPWDGRIHASSKEKIKDGTWKKKRGVVAELVATVETELRRLLAIPSPTAEQVAPPPPLAVASSVAVAPTSDAPASGAPASGAPPMTWVTVAQRCASIAASQRATTADVAAIFAANGMKGPADLMARPDFIPVIDAALTAAYGA